MLCRSVFSGMVAPAGLFETPVKLVSHHRRICCMSKRLFSMTLVLALMAMAPFAVAADKPATGKVATETAKAPRLTLVEPLKDFGTVPKGTKIDWSFEVKNTGTSDLEIISAKPTCGCTVADFDKV